MHKNFIYLALTAIFAVSACGFRPLYVEREGDSVWHYDGKFNTSIIQEMSKIKVEPVADRFGQLVRNNLLDSLTPKGAPSKPTYRLNVRLKKKTVTDQALRRDITASRKRVKYNVVYEMTRDGETLFRNNSIAFVGYDIMANPYSTTFAEKKTEEDAAKIISNDIILRIGAYFNTELIKASEYSDLQTTSD